MKRCFIIIAGYLLTSVVAASATPQVILDNYIGGRPNYVLGNLTNGTTPPADLLDQVRAPYGSNKYAVGGLDVIGDPATRFETTSMSVDFVNSNTLNVIIYSNFFNPNVLNATEGYGIGDLFISSDGYSTTGDTSNVWYGHGQESWNLALQLNNKNGTNGTLNAHNVLAQNIELSSVGTVGLADNKIRAYRGEQEVRYNGSGQDSLGAGTWSLIDSNNDGILDALSLSVAFDQTFSQLGGAIWGFHWTQTCGNDVIEGSAAVPEPSTMALLLAAVCGGLPLRRKVRRA